MEENLKNARQIAIQAQQAEKQFLANMSHEIRTPLNAIIGMTHLLNDTVLDSEQSEYLEVLGSSASILKNLISDILDISKIDAEILDVNLKATNLKAEAYKLINIFKAKTRESNVKFILEFDDKITNEVYCDQQLLSQVLINLLSNSEKFTPDGNVYLKISLKAHDSKSYIILFEVKDTGIGMTPEELERVFDQFTQANADIRSNYGGTGLGLTISKRLTDLMGGYLDVFSLQEKGTSFYFTLDLKISQTEADLDIKENGDLKSHISKNKINVLVVEDNEMNIKYITSLLRKWKLPHSVAYNGQEAIDLFHKKQFDLIFMDLNMPVMGGFEATRTIRDSKHNRKDVPIIALTASTFLSKKHLALQAGMTDFLSKPFTPDQLAELVSKYSETKLSTNMAQPTENNFTYNAALNTEHLNAVYADDLDYAKAMFETFLEIIDDEIHILISHAEKADLENIKSQTHKVKPTFSMVGLNHISEKMQEIEDNVLEMENDLVLKEVLFIQKELEHFKRIIAEEIKRIELTEKED
ncbi:UNVERIFIED_CONTAM: hypothetical protein GTU68_002430 [Idotea baltica]|nr:hypothetical protein [Idotea baltica]